MSKPNEPLKGSVWTKFGNPFGTRVYVVDVKDGWIQYHDGNPAYPMSCKLVDFLYNFREVKNG